jgi:hypothetical protein
MNPEWISTFPGYEAFEEYSKRELWMWILMTHGASICVYPLQAYYLRYVDYIGHNHPKRLRDAYNQVFLQASDLKKKGDVILLSDHGCKDGLHTERAYLGSDHSFNAEWVHELRADFERIFTFKKIECKEV